LKGNGIGPEIMAATQTVLAATGLPIEWVDLAVAEEALARYGHPLPAATIAAMREIGIVLKAPLLVNRCEGRITCTQPDGSEVVYPSLNNAIRRELGLFVCPRPVRGIRGVSGTYADLDVVILREITEDVYIGWEHAIGNVAAQAIKLTTRAAAMRVSRFAFEYARKNGRRKVSCVHKANVLNLTDGLFLRCFREVAGDYPDLVADDFMVDAACYLFIKDPARFDVIVTSNQYGDILSDLGAGLVGSLGLVPGANIGDTVAVFEATHGAAPDIAGRGIANPVALILSGAMALRHAGQVDAGRAVERAVGSVLAERRVLTPDLGGQATTSEIAQAIAAEVQPGSSPCISLA